MILRYDACNECAPAVMHGEVHSYTLEEVAAFIESHGLLTRVREADPGEGGYWECEACQQVTIGTGVVMELEL